MFFCFDLLPPAFDCLIDSYPDVHGNLAVRNSKRQDRMGGAIMCHDEERSPLADLLQLQVMHSNFTRNRGLDGGSLALISSSALVQGCSFIGDETDTVSSGVTSGIGGGGAIFCSTCDKTSIADSFFASCHAKASNGGAIFVQTLGSVAVTRSIFVSTYMKTNLDANSSWLSS